MARDDVKLMHECYPKHLFMGTSRKTQYKTDKEDKYIPREV